MKLTLSPVAAKIFGRSVQALARIGDELIISSTGEESLTLQVANTAKSAFGSVTFNKDFFHDRDDVQKFTVNVNTKGGILLAFRFTANFERSVQWCELIVSPQDSLTVRFVSRADVVKVYHVRLIDGQNFVYNVDLKKYPNFIKGPARLFLDVVSQFPSKVAEVTLAVTSNKLTLRNYVDEAETSNAVVHSNVAFERREFETFDVPNEAMDITFSLKTFKIILNYSEAQSLDVNIHYDKPGSHVIIFLTSNEQREFTHVKVMFVLATLDESTPDVVQEGRAIKAPSVRQKELSIQNVTATTSTRLQKVTSRFNESTVLEEEASSKAKRLRKDEDSDEEFASLLENDEDLHRIITQKEQEAVKEIQNRMNASTRENMGDSMDESIEMATPEDAARQETPTVSFMAKILMQNQAKARRGLLKVPEEEPEVLVPPSDEEDD